MKPSFVPADSVDTPAVADDQVTNVWGYSAAHHYSDSTHSGCKSAGPDSSVFTAADYTVATGKAIYIFFHTGIFHFFLLTVSVIKKAVTFYDWLRSKIEVPYIML